MAGKLSELTWTKKIIQDFHRILSCHFTSFSCNLFTLMSFVSPRSIKLLNNN